MASGTASTWTASTEPASSASRTPTHRPHAHDNVLNYVSPVMLRTGVADERPLYTEYSAETSLDELQRTTSLFFVLGAARSPQLELLSSAPGTMVLVVEPDVERLASFVDEVGAKRLMERSVFFLAGNVMALRDRLDEILSKELFGFGFPAFLSEEGRDWAGIGAAGTPHGAELAEPVVSAEPVTPAEPAGSIGPTESVNPTGPANPVASANLSDFVELIEAVYYRRIIYPLSGHDFVKNRPFRNIRKGLYFDAQKHLYENVPLYCRHGAFTMLKDRFAGCEALIVATGPELDQRLDYIRANQHRAVVVAVNNALETLVKNGIEPHFAVCVDNSTLIENSYAALPKLSRTILVTHCFSTVPRDVFPGVLFFGNLHSEAFPSIPSLKWHGSVLTACHFLAGFMGCSRCVYVAAQLSSPHPFQLGYCEETYHERRVFDAPQAELTGRYPQLYPVRSVSGEQVYTSLNFLDVALWLGAEIDRLGLPVVNTSPLSILRGEKVCFDPDYQVPNGRESKGSNLGGCDAEGRNADGRNLEGHNPKEGTAEACAPTGSDPKQCDPKQCGIDAIHAAVNTAIRFPRVELTKQYLQGEVGRWREVRKACDAALKAEDIFALGDQLFAHFEQDNTSYLVQRFGCFNNTAFHRGYIAGTEPARRESALRDYLTNIRDMAAQFVGILAKSLAELR